MTHIAKQTFDVEENANFESEEEEETVEEKNPPVNLYDAPKVPKATVRFDEIVNVYSYPAETAENDETDETEETETKTEELKGDNRQQHTTEEADVVKVAQVKGIENPVEMKKMAMQKTAEVNTIVATHHYKSTSTYFLVMERRVMIILI